MRSLQTVKKINDIIPIVTYAYRCLVRVEENVKYFLVGIISGLMVVFTTRLSDQLPPIESDFGGFIFGLAPLFFYNLFLFIAFIFAITLFESLSEALKALHRTLEKYP
ncbi:MAG: hypothetical protein GF334_10060 [Candidatus Altiarchaeales archaeon]|nr:hypothetical protein [Candidatus Altiarchaeales archaeon]